MRNHNKSLGGIEGSGNTGGSKWQFPVKVMQFAHRQKWDRHTESFKKKDQKQ